MGKSIRREFLRNGFLGLSAAALMPGAVRASVSVDHEQGETKTAELPCRILGKTGIRTPLLSLGAGGAYDPNFIRTAYNAGVKFFFSATYYGEGNNEKMVGEGLKGLPRESFLIATAVSADGFDNRQGLFLTPLDIKAYVRKAEESITRFGVDYVDIILFPYARRKNSVLNERLLEALTILKEQGTTKYVGIASHSDCDLALRAAAESNLYDVAMVSYNYKTQNLTEMNEALTYASQAGIGVVAMKTTAGAFRDKSRTNPLNTDAALKWVLQNKDIVSIVSGMNTYEQLEKNVAMINNLQMTDQEKKDLEMASLSPEQGLYCQQCRQCVTQCRYNLEIPTAMRSYMYAYGYNNMKQAKYTLSEAGLTDNPCADCDSCQVSCSSGFDIKERISDISRLGKVPGEFLV